MTDPTPNKQGDQTTVKPPVASVSAVKSNGKVLRTGFPSGKFIVEGLPIVTREGVRLTDEQAKVIEAAAKKSGVRIVEVTD